MHNNTLATLAHLAQAAQPARGCFVSLNQAAEALVIKVQNIALAMINLIKVIYHSYEYTKMTGLGYKSVRTILGAQPLAAQLRLLDIAKIRARSFMHHSQLPLTRFAARMCIASCESEHRQQVFDGLDFAYQRLQAFNQRAGHPQAQPHFDKVLQDIYYTPREQRLEKLRWYAQNPTLFYFLTQAWTKNPESGQPLASLAEIQQAFTNLDALGITQLTPEAYIGALKIFLELKSIRAQNYIMVQTTGLFMFDPPRDDLQKLQRLNFLYQNAWKSESHEVRQLQLDMADAIRPLMINPLADHVEIRAQLERLEARARDLRKEQIATMIRAIIINLPLIARQPAGMNVHNGQRDDQTLQAVERLYETGGATSEEDIEASYRALCEHIGNHPNEEERNKALKALNQPRAEGAHFGPLVSDVPFTIHGREIRGKEFVARLWRFVSNLDDERDKDNAKLAIINALRESIDQRGHAVCNQGKIQRLVVSVLQGRLAGVNVEGIDLGVISKEEALELFFAKAERRSIDVLDDLLEEANRFLDENPRVNRDEFLEELRKYAIASAIYSRALSRFLLEVAQDELRALDSLLEAANNFCDEDPSVERDAFINEIRLYAESHGIN